MITREVAVCQFHCREGCAVMIVQLSVLVGISIALVMIGIITGAVAVIILGALMLVATFVFTGVSSSVG